MKKIELEVENLLEKFLSETEYELIDVEYVNKQGKRLRIFVDKKNGIDFEDCQKLSEEIGTRLDDIDLIKESYTLEVSSPGIDRVLKKDRDFLREIGKEVEVTFYTPMNDDKIFIGILEGFDKNFLKLKDFEPLSREKIAMVRLHVNF